MAFCDECVELRLANFYEGELRGDKECVQQNQRDDDYDVDRNAHRGFRD